MYTTSNADFLPQRHVWTFALRRVLIIFSVLCSQGGNTTAMPTHSNITSILNNLLNGYDNRLRPGYGGESISLYFMFSIYPSVKI